MSRESQELLVSINGLSAAVKCCTNDLAAEFPSSEVIRLRVSAIPVTSDLFLYFGPLTLTRVGRDQQLRPDSFLCFFFLANLTHLNLV